METRMASYLETLRLQGRRALSTLAHGLRVYRQWLESWNLDLQAVSGEQAEEFQTDLVGREGEGGQLTYTAKTISIIMWVVRSFHDWLRAEGITTTNPFRHVPKMKLPRRVPRNVPTAPELVAALNTLARFWEEKAVRDKRTRYRVHVMAEVLYATGMRIGELSALAPSDFDLPAKTVHIRDGKGALARDAYLNDYAAAVVGIYLERMREFVHYRFHQPSAFGIGPGQNLSGSINRHLNEALGMTSHGFRHAVGTQLLSAGCDLRMIQLILGHEDMKSTAIYTQVVKEELRDQLDRYHPRQSAQATP